MSEESGPIVNKIDIHRTRLSVPLALVGAALASATVMAWKTSSAFNALTFRLDTIESKLNDAVKRSDFATIKAEIVEASKSHMKDAVVLCPRNTAKDAMHAICEIRFVE